jgi:hypothetical protein
VERGIARLCEEINRTQVNVLASLHVCCFGNYRLARPAGMCSEGSINESVEAV